jgi:hypothetical protein
LCSRQRQHTKLFREMIKLKKIGNLAYLVRNESGKLLGTFVLDVDGIYYWWQADGLNGAWTSEVLKEITTLLDEVNKPFDDEVINYLRRDFEERARVEYRQLLNESGMFYKFYPDLTGEYGKDKEQWLVIFKGLEKIRENFVEKK